MADVRCCLLAYFIPPSRLLLKLEEAQDIVNQKVFLTRHYVCERNCTTAESIPPRLLFITFPVAAVLFLNVYLFFIIICCCVLFWAGFLQAPGFRCYFFFKGKHLLSIFSTDTVLTLVLIICWVVELAAVFYQLLSYQNLEAPRKKQLSYNCCCLVLRYNF